LFLQSGGGGGGGGRPPLFFLFFVTPFFFFATHEQQHLTTRIHTHPQHNPRHRATAERILRAARLSDEQLATLAATAAHADASKRAQAPAWRAAAASIDAWACFGTKVEALEPAIARLERCLEAAYLARSMQSCALYGTITPVQSARMLAEAPPGVIQNDAVMAHCAALLRERRARARGRGGGGGARGGAGAGGGWRGS